MPRIPNPDPTKRITITLEEDLYDRLLAEAQLDRRSISAEAVTIIEADLDRRLEQRALADPAIMEAVVTARSSDRSFLVYRPLPPEDDQS